LEIFLETRFENLGNTGFFLHEVESHLMTGWGIYVFTTLPGDGWREKISSRLAMRRAQYQRARNHSRLCSWRMSSPRANADAHAAA